MKLRNLGKFPAILTLALVGSFGLVGCSDDGDETPSVEAPGEENEEEVITTVTLTFTPMGGGDEIIASWNDPDGDGGMAPTTEPITLAADTTYDLSVTFTNTLEMPAEDITEEIAEEDAEHQLFFGGTGVQSPGAMDAMATVAVTYDDQDGGGLPVGLASTVTTSAAGSAMLNVVLRHLPEMNGAAVKVAGLDATFAMSGASALPGDSDVDVTFDVTVE